MTPKETLAEGITAVRLRESLDERIWAEHITDPYDQIYCKLCHGDYDHEDGEIKHKDTCPVGIALSFPPSKAEAQAKAFRSTRNWARWLMDAVTDGTIKPKDIPKTTFWKYLRKSLQDGKDAGL